MLEATGSFVQQYACFVLFCLISHFHSWFCKLPTPEMLFDLHWDMHFLYGLTCLCLLFLLSALLTRVVCAHALLVSTSVSPHAKVMCVCLYLVAIAASVPSPSQHTLSLSLSPSKVVGATCLVQDLLDTLVSLQPQHSLKRAVRSRCWTSSGCGQVD